MKKSFEIDAKVGLRGVLTLQQLPFADGQDVHVCIQPKPAANGPVSRILGLHEGLVTISEDFDEPLPDSFWLGKEAGDGTSA